MNTYRNPWHRETIRDSKPFYTNDARPLLTHRGVTVYKTCDRQYDYVLEGCCITQRAGFSKATGPGLIDDILDGRTYEFGTVADHLEACGFNPRRFQVTLTQSES